MKLSYLTCHLYHLKKREKLMNEVHTLFRKASEAEAFVSNIAKSRDVQLLW